jgi:16S rRNA (cytosine967-C5)-methyltransferase
VTAGRGGRPGPGRDAAGVPARRVALQALVRIDHEGAYANLVLPPMLASSGLGDADRGLVTELVYGTVRRRRSLDAAVDRFVTSEPDPAVRSLLRLGAYQLLFTKVPSHAAVSTSVSLAPRKAAGFVNAVLRRVATNPVVWPDLATELSYPDWLVARLDVELGPGDARLALERMDEPPPVTTRADGYVQDRSSQWVAEAVGARPGERVADLCAAPGGKATALAHAVAPGGLVVAAELQPHRARLVAANAERLAVLGPGGPLAVVVADATSPALRPASFDRVLVDAPCSGLGALRRRPDARWRIAEADIDELAALQSRILAAARELVRPGGELVYSACTLTAAESVDHDTFGWEALPPPPAPWRPYGRGGRLLPQDADTDGMVLLRWRAP